MNNPRVGVIVINWNCFQDTAECVEALKKSTYQNIEIIVVDNASTDGSAEKVEQSIPGIVFIKSKDNLGWAGGNNLGVRDALNKGIDYVLLLNADAFVEPDTIEKMVRKAESSPDIGLVSPVLYYFSSRRLQHCGAGINWEKCTKICPTDIRDIDKIPPDRFWVWFTATLVKRKVIDVIGLFEEKYFCYCEDQEYSLRAYRAGFKIAVATDAKVFHRCHEIDVKGQADLPPYFFFYITRNNFFFFQKYSSRKFRFYRKFLAKTFAELGHSQKEGRLEAVDAYLDGLYCGLKGIAGRWDKTKKMPRWIKAIILAHPFFWSDMLNGDFLKIFKLR
ncbi:MAG: glycosyltransferase family 2 protein [Candidatus Omnitrophota bacterium]|nr:glycosyltransferase family 2 protein [Candidatus Omnitrophota bacterium]